MSRPSSLSEPATILVLKTLQKYKRPMSAYELLDILKIDGIKSPPIIYRALDSLVLQAKIHKINTLGLFIACNQEHDHLAIIVVCNKCNIINELHDDNITAQINNLQQFNINFVQNAVIELPITCSDCV